MSSIHTLIDLFIDTPSLANAKKLVAKTVHNPMSMCLISEDHAGMVCNAERMVADAKNPGRRGVRGRALAGGDVPRDPAARRAGPRAVRARRLSRAVRRDARCRQPDHPPWQPRPVRPLKDVTPRDGAPVSTTRARPAAADAAGAPARRVTPIRSPPASDPSRPA